MPSPHHPATEPDSTDDTATPPVAGSAVMNTLVENHREFLGFLERRVGDRATAEDILQEAFARGMDRVDTLREGDSAVAWFYRLLRNAVVDHYRRRGTSSRALEKLAREMESSEQPDAETRGAVCQCVTRLAATLKPEYAEALREVEVGGVAVKDFAERAGISSGNAAVRVFRAREALRKRVMESCGTCAEHGCLDCHCGDAGHGGSHPTG